jgi:hypothetical protein
VRLKRPLGKPSLGGDVKLIIRGSKKASNRKKSVSSKPKGKKSSGAREEGLHINTNAIKRIGPDAPRAQKVIIAHDTALPSPRATHKSLQPPKYVTTPKVPSRIVVNTTGSTGKPSLSSQISEATMANARRESKQRRMPLRRRDLLCPSI